MSAYLLNFDPQSEQMLAQKVGIGISSLALENFISNHWKCKKKNPPHLLFFLLVETMSVIILINTRIFIYRI